MHCPYCSGKDSEVVETRVGEDGDNIRRRRTCIACKKRFTTYERVENVSLIVKKKDGRREQFSRDKLRIGIIRACEKTSVSLLAINEIVGDIERELRGGDTIEVDSSVIGKTVADRLKKLDKLAYIRFASVFKRFVDLEDFEKEIKKLIK